jgi:hypothetical protein
MAELKTKPTAASVEAFLDAIADEGRRRDCRTILKIMKRATGSPPKMWGKSIVGFGSYHYRYATGREGDWFVVGFSPRKQDLTLYLMGAGFTGYGALLKKLGQHKTGRACLYLKRLADVDLDALRELVEASVAQIARTQR